MIFFNFLTLIGGLALFLYGMETMSNSLTNVSGPQMKTVMQDLTSNRLKGALLGAGVTALIQSSGGTTVVVVGLVNSGVMNLVQAASVIMGANIGTTITAWILSLASLSSDNFFIQLFKPESLSPIFAFIGIILLFTSKSLKNHEMGKIFLGFAVLMFGMKQMSTAMEPLAKMEGFGNILVLFSNPVLGVIAGALVTTLVQSSSASVGILQSLSATGIVSYQVALPIIMGQNIGACTTTLLSTIGAKKNAKRAAVIHLLFNMIGTIIFLVGFYTINYIRPFEFMVNNVNPVGIAIIHTTMNIITTAILLPSSNTLVALAMRLIPQDEKEKEKSKNIEFRRLDDRLLETPSLALNQCYELSKSMFSFSQKALKISLEIVSDYDTDKYQEVIELEDLVDKYEDKLGRYMVKFSSRKLMDTDDRLHTLLLQCIGDFERIADHAKNIAQSAKEKYDKKYRFTDGAFRDLMIFASAANKIVEKTSLAYTDNDIDEAKEIEPLEEVIDNINQEIKLRHITRVRQGTCNIELGFVLADISTSLERIADHCSNIAVSIITINQETYTPHKYIGKLRKDSPEFAEAFNKMSEEFSLTKELE